MKRDRKFTISLTDQQFNMAEARARQLGYPSRSAYFAAVVRGDAGLQWDHTIPKKIAAMGEAHQEALDAEILSKSRTAAPAIGDSYEVENVIEMIRPGRRVAIG